jgi:hypothetical protein
VIQRTIGVALGALATYLLLVLLNPANSADPNSTYLTAVVVGAVVSWAWPFVIGIWLGRRAKQRRDDRIEKEVQRQLDEERAKL